MNDLIAFIRARLDEDEASYEAGIVEMELTETRRLILTIASETIIAPEYLAEVATAWEDHPDYLPEWRLATSKEHARAVLMYDMYRWLAGDGRLIHEVAIPAGNFLDPGFQVMPDGAIIVNDYITIVPPWRAEFRRDGGEWIEFDRRDAPDDDRYRRERHGVWPEELDTEATITARWNGSLL